MKKILLIITLCSIAFETYTAIIVPATSSCPAGFTNIGTGTPTLCPAACTGPGICTSARPNVLTSVGFCTGCSKCANCQNQNGVGFCDNCMKRISRDKCIFEVPAICRNCYYAPSDNVRNLDLPLFFPVAAGGSGDAKSFENVPTISSKLINTNLVLCRETDDSGVQIQTDGENTCGLTVESGITKNYPCCTSTKKHAIKFKVTKAGTAIIKVGDKVTSPKYKITVS